MDQPRKFPVDVFLFCTLVVLGAGIVVGKYLLDLPIPLIYTPPTTPINNFLYWSNAKKLILTGDVVGVTQSHNLVVTLTTTSGHSFSTVEPDINEIFEVIKDCGLLCGRIVQSTE